MEPETTSILLLVPESLDKSWQKYHTCQVAALPQRLKQFRLARGFSLEELASHMAGAAVSRQALSQFENGQTSPSPRTLLALAKTLQVSSSDLLAEPVCSVHFVAYRKLSGLGKRDQAEIEARVSLGLQQYVRVQSLLAPKLSVGLPSRRYPVVSIDQAESAALKLRTFWQLGLDPIGDLMATLEDKHVYVLEMTTHRKFDGISAFASVNEKPVASMVVTQGGLAGERQRMNIAHELGHLVLEPGPGLDEEKAAFRFAASFLAPASELIREVGAKRNSLDIEELLLLKRRFGLSIQALLYRLHDLNVISDGYFKSSFIAINRRGWRKAEPEPLPAEKPTWLRQNLLRAVSEDILSHAEASRILGEAIDGKPSESGVVHREMARLSVAQRRRLLAKQAEVAAPEYEVEEDWIAASSRVNED